MSIADPADAQDRLSTRVVQLDDGARDAQAQPEAAALVEAFGLAHAIEDVREERRLDPLPFVLHPDAQLAVQPLHAQVDVCRRG